MGYFHITGNFAKKGQCGRCKHMIICGCITGVCRINDYSNCMTEDECDCGKYEEGEPECD